MSERGAGGERPERPRLFVALELPQAWHSALDEAQAALRRQVEGGPSPVRLRWVRPEGVHITLKFLGEVEVARMEMVEAALARLSRERLGFDLHLGKAGSFGDRRGPRVVWVGLAGDIELLAALAGAVEALIAPLGFPTERRPFAPHLTLARVPDELSPAERQALAAQVERLVVPGVPPFHVRQVSLMRSHLGRGGARYERVASYQ